MRFYLDTSVVGGYYDKEFSKWTRELFNQIIDKRNKISIVYSELTINELENAPEKVKKVIDLIPNSFKQFVEIDEKSERLAASYIESEALNENCEADALHIALASIHVVDVLVSWNFKHMVNVNRIEKYNKINRRYGYPAIDIREPKNVLL